MKLIIDISEEKYKAITEMYETFPKDMKDWGLEAIKNGTTIKMAEDLVEDCIRIASRYSVSVAECVNLINALPQPKRGKWIHREDMDYLDKNKVIHNHFMCQNCGFVHDFIDGHTAQYKYCPSCGEDMREIQDEDKVQ